MVAYRHFLDWLGGLLSEEIGVLFNPSDPANRLYPPQRVLDEVLSLINDGELEDIWASDETIGWVYQYFTPKELRDLARGESAVPRNSYELAFRNQFFTPRYVVEFLTDNTLGRIWYEMRNGHTTLKDQCRYLARRPNEVFLDEGQQPPKDTIEVGEDLSQNELLKLPAYIIHRPKKDPRELKILDPACGSGHFLLYSFDLLLKIYEEAYTDPDLGPAFQQDYPTLDALRRDVPRLILAYNLHGIDIDLRCTQIAALALWLRCQRAFHDIGLKKGRPKITRSNIVCAEPMPGEEALLDEFLKTLDEHGLEVLIRRVTQVPDGQQVRATHSMADSLCELVRLVWDKMQLAGEAGSLLKIEQELQEAIRKGQEEWEEKQPLFRITEFSMREEPKEHYLRIVPGEGVSFWERAESLVMAALTDFAGYAKNGRQLQRRLFADDAVRGFALVDVCQKRFDVVQMNPPFGADCKRTKPYIKTSYPDSHNDVAYAFVDRALELLADGGMVGAITTRTGFFLPTFSDWRLHALGGGSRIATCADLGYGVLEALVETAAYVLRRSEPSASVLFIDLLQSIEKEESLLQEFKSRSARSYLANPNLFASLPGTPLAYWAPAQLLSAFQACSPFEPSWGVVKRGIATGDNDRFLRLWWEVAPSMIGRSRWIRYAKGGEYSPYFIPSQLLLDWKDDGHALKTFTDENGRLRSRPQNLEFFFRRGLAYSSRTTSGFGPRVLAADHGFDQTSNPIFLNKEVSPATALAVLMSRPTQAFIELSVGSGDTSQSGTAARDYTNGLIGTVPVPELSDAMVKLLEQSGVELTASAREDFVHDETTMECRCLTSRFSRALTIRQQVENSAEERVERKLQMLRVSHKLDDMAIRAFGLSEAEMMFLDRFIGPHPCSYPHKGQIASSHFAVPARQETKKCYWADRDIEAHAHKSQTHPDDVVKEPGFIQKLADDALLNEAKGILSYCFGASLGRWDVRCQIDDRQSHAPFDPFAPLPVCSPGMLHGTDGLPATETPVSYPMAVDWDGILVDEPEHPDDVTQRVRAVLEVIWKERAEAIEIELCGLVGVKGLRDYLRKPTKGGFFVDHISRYSKGRRSAPIYWLVQSSKKNYALWLYYQRLDKDLLFKALVNYVEPKLQREVNRLDELRRQKQAGGVLGTRSKKLDKEMERQEDFLSELRDFEDKLRRAANLHLQPDLNDGVVLNIAPLWELVPWKEAKKYWDELLAGKYEWSSIGKQLREK